MARAIGGTGGRVAEARTPRAFEPSAARDVPRTIEPIVDTDTELAPVAPPKSAGWLARIAWTTGGILISLALGLAAERLIRDLFSTSEWLGWVGLAILALFVLALAALLTREALALLRLRTLDRLRRRAAEVLLSDKRAAGKAVLAELNEIYHARADLARARENLDLNARDIFDGSEIVRLCERTLMAPLDARAKVLTAASARRVALVTTVSPRALIDIAFVIYESVRLGRDIARLYGARPGLFGTWRLLGAILAHLAVTGGLVLTDGVVEQLVGQGLAAKLSARLGEGIVNGLMTVRVGIAAMRVVRPLPFETQRQPMVKDFMSELATVASAEKSRG
ncbi:MAG: TIGR01620 family protein [Devosia sp.]|nr:TIGR01620 family protein [Devosia sp.]